MLCWYRHRSHWSARTTVNRPPPPPPTPRNRGHQLDDAGVAAALAGLLPVVEVARGEFGAGYLRLLAHPTAAVRATVGGWSERGLVMMMRMRIACSCTGELASQQHPSITTIASTGHTLQPTNRP